MRGALSLRVGAVVEVAVAIAHRQGSTHAETVAVALVLRAARTRLARARFSVTWASQRGSFSKAVRRDATSRVADDALLVAVEVEVDLAPTLRRVCAFCWERAASSWRRATLRWRSSRNRSECVKFM
jgi:hypothetical protein